PHPEQGGEWIMLEYLRQMSEAECIWRFRFTAGELQLLADLLQLLKPLITAAGSRASPLEAILIRVISLLCARLQSPEDQWSLSTKYHRPQSTISQITNETASFINARWGFLLDWDRHGLLSPEKLGEYADALYNFGAPCRSVFGFIDCTIRQTCQPGMYQELAYTGYKKCHGMKFQGVVV
ncbi:hypothetical protein JB92DRAFT_2547751, partial [Gautieria morchelliformis]